MELTKQLYGVIQAAARAGKTTVEYNKSWSMIHQELGIGSLDRGNLNVTSADWQKLRDWCKSVSGADPMYDDIDGDRIEVAGKFQDEKWSSKSAIADMCMVSSKSGVIPLKQGDVPVLQGTLISISLDDLALSRLDTIIVVENAIIARYWHDVLIPGSLDDALMIYRGHGENTRLLMDWLKALPSTVYKVGYLDFDPAGLGIAVDFELDAILVPDPIDQELVKGHTHNKPKVYHDQCRQRSNLMSQLSENWRPILSWMNDHEAAVTQESIQARGYSLVLLEK